MNIVCGIDDKFVMPCGVLMTSIFENNKGIDITFYILTQGLLPCNVNKLKELANRYQQKLSIVIVSQETLKGCPTAAHISIASYNRILASDILPADLDKCLYLDADMIVNGPIIDLYNTDLGNAAIGAVIDQSCDDIRHYNRLGLDSDKGYFNAGLLLINLKLWKKEKLSPKILEYIDTHTGDLLFHDQDALNGVLQNSKIFLPMKYNMQFSFLYKTPFIAKHRWNEMHDAAENPVIIHYTNKIKPWHRDCIHPYKEIWKSYYSKTIWGKNNLKAYSLGGYLKLKLKRVLASLKIRKTVPPAMLRSEFYKYYR